MRHRLLPAFVGLVLIAAPGLGASAAAGPGLTGTARFETSGARPEPAASHLHFDLSVAYAQVVGAMEGNPAIGVYRRHLVTQAGTRCDVELLASGRAYRSRPVLRRGVLALSRTRVHVHRSGRSGRLTWYIGVTRGDAVHRAGGDGHTAVAVFRAPSRYRSSAAPWAVVRLRFEPYPGGASTTTAQDGRECDRVGDASDGELGRAVRSMRLVGGRAHGTTGAQVEPAAS